MSNTVRLNGFSLDLDRAELLDAGGERVDLRAQSMAVLIELARHRGELVTKRALMQAVWPGIAVTDDSIVQCIVDIRRVLGDTQQRLLRTLPRRGYTLIKSDDETPAPSPAATPVADMAPRQRLWVYALVARDADRDGAAAPRSPLGANVAVLPLRTVPPGDAAESARSHAGLDSEGLAFMISGELARNAEMRVASTLVTTALAREGLSAQQIGKKLDVRYVVDGSFARRGERLHIEAQLIDTRDDSIAWTWKFEPSASELPAATDSLVERVARSLGATVRELRKAESLRRPPATLDVYARVLRGIALKHTLTPAGLRQARLELTEAVQLDPAYAPAWLYLGWVRGIAINNRTDSELGPADMPQAISEVRRALELDPTLPIAWQGLAVVLVYAGRFDEAIDAAEQAVKLGPGDPDNRLFLGMAQHNAGRHEASLRNVEKAMGWNPIRPAYYPAVHAFAAYGAGRHAEALTSARECTERAPAIVRCKAVLLSSLVRLGKADEARAALAGSPRRRAGLAELSREAARRR